jgi:Uma2 family endonuclease
MPVSEATYEQLSLEDPKSFWELVCGHLRVKPAMAVEHEDTMRILAGILERQLDATVFGVGMNSPHLRISTGEFFIPDVCVIPRSIVSRRRAEQPRRFEVDDEPMPLVVEVWSPSTGTHDVEDKLREYQRRGDREIWRIHPYERTLTAWRRQPDGSYNTAVIKQGIVQPVALPDLSFEIESLFAG